MKLLLVNLHSSHNAGDDVLTRVTVRQLRQSFADPELTLAMNDPTSYEGPGRAIGSFMTWLKRPDGSWRWLHGVGALALSLLAVAGYRLVGMGVLGGVPRYLRPLLRAYFEADVVVSSAGNFLYSGSGLGVPFFVAVYIMAYGWLAGKRLYTMPQTIGPLRRKWEQWLTRWILGRMEMVFVRDGISRQLLASIGGWQAHCRLVPDLAFALPPAPRQQGGALLQNHGVDQTKPLLGVTLINWAAQNRLFERQEEYETAVATAIRSFVTRLQGQVVLFSQVRGPTFAEDDRVPARRVWQRLHDLGDAVVMIETDPDPETLKAAYGLMNIFLGTRLHSNIFALSEGVPAVTIQYQYKTRGIMRMLALEAWVVDIKQVEAGPLVAHVAQLWQERAHLRTHLQMVMPPIVEQAANVGAIIAADLAQKRATR